MCSAGQRQLYSVRAVIGPNDGLKGCTSSTVSVRRVSQIYGRHDAKRYDRGAF